MNQEIIDLISKRLEIGKKQYSDELDVHDGRNWSMETLEEALDMCVYLTAEIIKRTTSDYKYLFTLREANKENSSEQYDSMGKLNRDRLKEIAYWIVSEPGDLHDVYIDSCWEISPSGEVVNVMPTGANVYVDWILDRKTTL